MLSFQIYQIFDLKLKRSLIFAQDKFYASYPHPCKNHFKQNVLELVVKEYIKDAAIELSNLRKDMLLIWQ